MRATPDVTIVEPYQFVDTLGQTQWGWSVGWGDGEGRSGCAFKEDIARESFAVDLRAIPRPRLNVGCGTHYAAGYWNVDVWENDDTHPDQIVAPGAPLPFPDGSCERICAAHVMEHIPFVDTPAFLHDLKRLLAPGGTLLVAGPDVIRTLNRWRDGLEPWWLVESVMEHGTIADITGPWPGARHHWTCHEQRVLDLLDACGWDAVPWTGPEAIADGWPLVNWSDWQFAIRAVPRG